MEGARCAFQDHNVKVAHAHSLIFLMAKLILTFATLVLLLTIKVLRYMGLIFMEHVQVHNIVQTLYLIAFPKFLMEANVIVSTLAILGFVQTNNVCVDRHPIVRFPQTKSVLAKRATIFKNLMGSLAQLSQHALPEYALTAYAMEI